MHVEDVSRELEVNVAGWGKMVKRAAKITREADEIGKRMEVVGEEGISLNDIITYLKGELFEFSYLQQNAFDKEDAYCPLSRQIPLFLLVNKIFDMHFEFDSQDTARNFFLELQNEMKNMNFLPYKSERYEQLFEKIEKKLESVAKKEQQGAR
jgi:V/A-type H+-transporting ATPase subunit A